MGFTTEITEGGEINEKSRAPSEYVIIKIDGDTKLRTILDLPMQDGLPKEKGFTGFMVEDLIKVAIMRLNSYQESEFACENNYHAIRHLEEALEEIEKRTADRVRRNVEGTYQK